MKSLAICTLFLGVTLEAQTYYLITTLAGSGEAGDGGPVASAWLGAPAGVAADSAGNLYVAEPRRCRVRRVTPAGIIDTYAGSGVCAYGGDNGPATAAQLVEPWGLAVDGAGNLYIADRTGNRVRKVSVGRNHHHHRG
jgi:glucose/arabinose dehydrogenase